MRATTWVSVNQVSNPINSRSQVSVFKLLCNKIRSHLVLKLPCYSCRSILATLADEPFYTKWWFLIIVGLLILMVVIVFVATLCVTSANAWKREHEKQKKQGVYDTHQLPDDFVVSYELQSKRDR